MLIQIDSEIECTLRKLDIVSPLTVEGFFVRWIRMPETCLYQKLSGAPIKIGMDPSRDVKSESHGSPGMFLVCWLLHYLYFICMQSALY